MWLSIIFLAAIVVVAMKVSAQGLFGAFIMLVLSISCLGVSFGLYEWFAATLIAPNWKPDYALPIALGVLFGVPLIILRILFDRLIRRACLLPNLVEKIGGWVFGLLTAMILVGVAATCVQMIPFSYGSILGFSRVKVVPSDQRLTDGADPEASGVEQGLMLSPDSFVVGLASILSDGIFSGEQSFGTQQPNLLQTIGWVGATDLEVSRFAPPGSIGVVRTAVVPYVFKITPGNERRNTQTTYEPQTPGSGQEFRMVRVRLNPEARDQRKSHGFTLRQFRLVGSDGPGGAIRQYHPVAIQQADATEVTNRHIISKRTGKHFWLVADDALEPREGNNNQVEIVFELPTAFEPDFIEYKRLARAKVSFKDSDRVAPPDAVKPPPADGGSAARSAPSAASTASDTQEAAVAPPTSANSDTSSRSGRRRGGRVRGVAANTSGSHFGDDLPVKMRAYQALNNAEIARGAMAGGHLVGDFDAQASGTQPEVIKFDVPGDMRLLHLASQGLQSRSTLGRALSQAATTVQNYFVTDANGKPYKLVGKYALATVNGKKIVEVQYFKDQVGTVGGVGQFKKIDERKLGASDTFALLFLVDPGAKIVSFSTGGSASRQDDLSDQDLIAPR
jgi:hypothetical protein